MTTHIRLHVVAYLAEPRVPRLDALGGVPLPEYFSQATGGALILDPVHHQIEAPLLLCTADELHDVAARFLPSEPERPAKDVALIFAHSYHVRQGDLYGLMFDRNGVEEAVGEMMETRGAPRQACAVFVDAIGTKAAALGWRRPRAEANTIHTAIHELGHVFNLLHDESQMSFMGEDTEAVGFNGFDCRRLRGAAAGRRNWAPGGSDFGSYPTADPYYLAT